MQITATQKFRHGYDTYEEGETYEMPPELGGYFVLNGWATSPDMASPGELPSADVTLKVDDAHHDHEAEH